MIVKEEHRENGKAVDKHERKKKQSLKQHKKRRWEKTHTARLEKHTKFKVVKHVQIVCSLCCRERSAKRSWEENV